MQFLHALLIQSSSRLIPNMMIELRPGRRRPVKRREDRIDMLQSSTPSMRRNLNG